MAINPGAAWVTKRWPPERYGALARELGERHGVGVLVLFGPGEEGLAAAVLSAAYPARPASLPSSVRELAALSERALLLVSGDTGPYHIARALGVPTLGLFGPTDPARNGPRGGRDRVLWGRVPCSPCYGRDCPTAIECMAAVELPDVLAAAAELLEKAASTPAPPAPSRSPVPPTAAPE